MKEITLVIQGKISQDSYKFYCHFYPGVRKIFSTWVDNDKTMGWKIGKNMHGPEDLFIESVQPNNLGDHARNLQLQVVSTLTGLNLVKTKYAIKLRGDEWYSNLCDLDIDWQKIYTVPVFFRKWEIFPFHPSDHLMASKTDNLVGMFTSCLLDIITKKNLHADSSYCVGNNCKLHPGHRMTPECCLAKSYMDFKMQKKSIYTKDDFKNMFDIIPINDLMPYKICMNSKNKVWYSNFDPANDESLGSLSCIEEL